MQSSDWVWTYVANFMWSDREISKINKKKNPVQVTLEYKLHFWEKFNKYATMKGPF